jgi:peptidoglycan hydrolase CwlO-like protein
MHIERVQVEEGFLDGFDLVLVPGLNVLIGARGTGKTSLIELIRFCLNVRGYTPETDKRSRDHALSVLGSGQVTVTLSDGARKIIVTRTANDVEPRASGPFEVPIIFSQTEIETIGLRPSGRLQLLDSFTGDRRKADAAEAEAVSAVRSLTAEAEALRREIDEFSRQIAGLTEIDQQLAALAPAEQQLAKVSSEAAEKKKKLDATSIAISSRSVAATTIERFKQGLARWQASLTAASNSAPAAEPWPPAAGNDPLSTPRERIKRVRVQLQSALTELASAATETAEVARRIGEQKLLVEEQARQLRKEIEALQAGAGTVARQGQQLRERKAQLESLRGVTAERVRNLEGLLQRRRQALDRLDAAREARSKARAVAATQLNAALGPRIRITLSRAGQFEAFGAAIAEVLRGSGLRYGDLALALAEHVSPRELLEAADSNDFDLIADAAGISRDRAARVLAQLKESDLGTLATVAVEDYVGFQLLDGSDYKDIPELSTGQRCTVVLPLVLRHTERLLIVDQPEDHIDNAFIADTLIRAIVARDSNGQTLFSTHNANIPVLGNADRVVHLGSDGRRGFALVAAPLNDPTVVSAITTVMEGGAEAFERRASFYGRHKRH